MPSRYPQSPVLLAVALLVICAAWPFSPPVEAKEKKGKSASSQSSSRSKSKGQSSAKRGKRRSDDGAEDNRYVIPTSYPIAPDRVEVIESGEASSPDVSRHLNPPVPRAQTTQPSSEPDTDQAPPAPRKGLKIDGSRVLQIQQALNKRGFYTGGMTGAYDQATIEAMRRFQVNQKIPVTGYPTAHALKRLGLTSW